MVYACRAVRTESAECITTMTHESAVGPLPPPGISDITSFGNYEELYLYSKTTFL